MKNDDRGVNFLDINECVFGTAIGNLSGNLALALVCWIKVIEIIYINFNIRRNLTRMDGWV